MIRNLFRAEINMKCANRFRKHLALSCKVPVQQLLLPKTNQTINLLTAQCQPLSSYYSTRIVCVDISYQSAIRNDEFLMKAIPAITIHLDLAPTDTSSLVI